MTSAQRDLVLAGAPELQTCLQEACGSRSVKLADQEQLTENVHRLVVDVDGTRRSLVVKSSDSAVARRSWLVARRWLPAVGLEGLGPPLLTIAAEQNGQRAWHVYEDLAGRALSADRPVDSEVAMTIDAIARVHTSFAEHPLLRECRLWGGDRGVRFYSSNVHDAILSLRSLDLKDRGAAARDALLERLNVLRTEESDRAGVLAAVGGPETLVHGDLWPTNAIVLANGERLRVRLIDWDEAAAGPAWFDVSTFLLRFEPSYRLPILDAYREAVERLAGWTVPGEQDLNVIFETAAHARLASLLVWSIAAAGEGVSGWLIERLEAMTEWLDQVHPVLPPR